MIINQGVLDEVIRLLSLSARCLEYLLFERYIATVNFAFRDFRLL